MKVLTPLVVAALLPAQSPDDVLATFQLDGKTAAITRTDVALEMAFHLRRRDRGQQAVEQLVAATLTRRAAHAKKLMPTEPEVRAFWDDLQQQLRAAGQRPEEFAAVRNTSEKQLLEDVALQMAQERLVRAELGLSAKERVSGDMMQLWLQEEKKRCEVVSDAELLPPGVAARVGEINVPLLDLGMLLLRTSEDNERDRNIRQVAYLTTLEALARKEGFTISEADLDAAVARRREEARDPRFGGVTLENLLKSQGLTVEAWRESRVFRASILLDKLAARRFPADALAAEIARDRDAVLELVGPRRRISVVFVRALDPPNALVTRDFDAAMRHLEAVRARLAKETFENVARIESEHNGSKAQGGDVGWHRRRSDKLPEPVLAAAFALPAGEVSMPVRADDGAFLVKAVEVEPVPGDEALAQRLREHRTLELSQKLLDDAKVAVVAAKPAGGAR